ncbi:MAG: Crp/Fnr family transcriptional regulator [bacterium]
MKKREEIISRVDVFFALGNRERRSLVETSKEVKLDPRNPLFQQGATAEWAYVIGNGHIKTFSSGPNGRRLLVDFIQPGDLVGEESVLFGGDYEVDAVSIGPCRVLALPASALRESIESSPRTGFALGALTASRARAYRERLCLVSTCPVQIRLISVLHHLARRFGQRHRSGTMLGIKVTHQDLADYIGASRETVSHLLSSLREQGIIANNVRRLVVPDMKALKRMAEHKE